MQYTKDQIIAAGHEDMQHAWHQERQRNERLARELKHAHDFIEAQGLWSQFISIPPPWTESQKGGA